jgi:hypothetical protein
LLQLAHSDYQIGPLENLHQLVENTSLVALGGEAEGIFSSNICCASLTA